MEPTSRVLRPLRHRRGRATGKGAAGGVVWVFILLLQCEGRRRSVDGGGRSKGEGGGWLKTAHEGHGDARHFFLALLSGIADIFLAALLLFIIECRRAVVSL